MRKLLALLLCLPLLLSGCSNSSRCLIGRPSGPARYSADFFDTFDTYSTFTAYAESEEEFALYFAALHDEMLRLHQLFDIYNDYDGVNNIKTINDNAGIRPVEVNPSILDLLELSIQACHDTDGTVNIAMGAVLRIWHEYREEGGSSPQDAQLPDREELRNAARHTDINDVIIDREQGTVYLRDPEMSLDVGAIAKGYGAQRGMDAARQAGLSSGILSAGGNIVTVGAPADGRAGWSVGVQSPVMEDSGLSDALWDTLTVADMSVVSSGDYQRFYTVDGAYYHHIIDPETLFPVYRYRTVTVLHSDSTVADILSTAAFILPQQQALTLIEAHGAEASWILPDHTTVSTDGYLLVSKNAQQGK